MTTPDEDTALLQPEIDDVPEDDAAEPDDAGCVDDPELDAP